MTSHPSTCRCPTKPTSRPRTLDPSSAARNSILNRKEGNVLLNDALNTFYLRLYGVRHIVKDHSDSERNEGRKCFICSVVRIDLNMSRPHWATRKEGNVLFNAALNTFYLRLYGVRHIVKDHSDSETGNPLPPRGLLFPISSKGSFICIIPQTG